MSQRSDRRTVAPRVEGRDDPATGPGRLLADIRAVQQHDALYFGREIERRQQANHPAADNHHLLLPAHVLIQPFNRQRA